MPIFHLSLSQYKLIGYMTRDLIVFRLLRMASVSNERSQVRIFMLRLPLTINPRTSPIFLIAWRKYCYFKECIEWPFVFLWQEASYKKEDWHCFKFLDAHKKYLRLYGDQKTLSAAAEKQERNCTTLKVVYI